MRGNETRPAFDDADLLAWLDAATPDEFDQLPYGIVRLDAEGIVTHYNRAESEWAGLSPERVLVQPFFAAIALCADNALVAGRYAAEPELDATLDYLFTFRMRSTPVRLRLLQSARAKHRFFCVLRS